MQGGFVPCAPAPTSGRHPQGAGRIPQLAANFSSLIALKSVTSPPTRLVA